MTPTAVPVMPRLSFLPTSAEQATGLLLRFLAVSTLLLCGLTWPLWGAQTIFPQVPFFGWLRTTPSWVDTTFGVVMCAALLTTAGLRTGAPAARLSGLLAAVAMSTLILLDQHRLQPWAWQFLVLAVLLTTTGASRALSLARLFIISIYVYSAWSKIDAGFVEEHGRYLLDGLLAPLGRSTRWWSAESVRYAAMLMPLGELLTAVLLAVPALRRGGVGMSIVMHGGLLLALGPLGHDHEPAVQAWNVGFILQNLLLFGVRMPVEAAGTETTGESPQLEAVVPQSPLASASRDPQASQRFTSGWSSAVIGPLIVWGAVLLPLLEPWGLFDKWPSWSVYSARTARMILFVDADLQHRFPPEWRQALQPTGPEMPGMLRLRYERVSLEQLGAPVYPEVRYVCGVAVAIAAQTAADDGILLIVETPVSRWRRQTRYTPLHGVKAIRNECRRYFLNALPRTGNFMLEDPI